MHALLAQEAPAPSAPAGPDGGPTPQQGSPWGFLVPILLMWLVIWFFVLRPQRKQEKDRQARVGALKKGDRVRTRGGIVAPVVRVKDDLVVVALGGDRSVEVEVHKSYIDDVTAADGSPKGDSK